MNKVVNKSIEVPQNQEEANNYIADIGIAQRKRDKLKASMNDKIEKIRTEYASQVKVLNDDIKDKTEGLSIWAAANRSELTKGGRVKFAKLAMGEINWRKLPARVNIRGKEKVIEVCKSLGLEKFIRVKEDINKEAMRDDMEAAMAITGVSIGSDGEQFVVKPNETEIEEAI